MRHTPDLRPKQLQQIPNMLSALRSATRGLAGWRGGLAVAILTLAVGIGTATTLYALVRVLLVDLPGVPELDRVGRVYASSATLGVERSEVALNEFDVSLSRAASFGAIGAYAQADVTAGSGDDEPQVRAGYASPGFFGALGVAAAEGRAFTAADLTAAQPVAMVSDAFWRRRLGGRPLAGTVLPVNGVNRAVVGVMPAVFSYNFLGVDADVWIPLGHASWDAPAIVAVFARLRPGVGWNAAASELNAMKVARGPWTWRAIPIQDDTRYRAAAAYGVTLGPALVILLLACVNVACLLLARGIARERELGIRRALGATRARVARMLVQEHLVLALAGGGLGCALAVALLRAIGAALAAAQPALAARVAVDVTLLPVALGTSVLACLVFGLLPAARLSRRDAVETLRGAAAAPGVDVAGYSARDAVVFAELASAVALIVFAAMLLNMFRAFGMVTPTFAADRLVTMRVAAADLDQITARVAAIPGIDRVTVSSGMLGGRGGAGGVRVNADGGRVVAMSQIPVGDAFFETLGLPILRGRTFDASELRRHAAVAVLSESAARALAPAGDPIGMRIHLAARTSATALVIGVCRDAIDYGALARIGLYPPNLYVPFDAAATIEPVILARASADPHRLLSAVAAAVQAPAGARRPQAGVLGDETAFGDRGEGLVIAEVLAGFGAIALLLAATGIVGVIGQSVAQRTREFGIRLAIGAPPRHVLGLVLAREVPLIGAALLIGAAFTLAITRAMFVELAMLSATAPLVWLALVGLCGGTASIALWLATRRIVRLEPAVVLRRS
jgi:putative ABC transport system permease protein